MKKSIYQFAIITVAAFASLNLTSCKKDNDTVPGPGTTPPTTTPPVTIDQNGVAEANNYFIISGGPFSAYKYEYTDSSQLRAMYYTSDSCYFMMTKNTMDNATIQVNGSSAGTYPWSIHTQMAMIFTYNDKYYTIECDSSCHNGSVTIASFNSVGGKVTGTLSANTKVTDATTGTSYPVSLTGKFELKRVL